MKYIIYIKYIVYYICVLYVIYYIYVLNIIYYILNILYYMLYIYYFSILYIDICVCLTDITYDHPGLDTLGERGFPSADRSRTQAEAQGGVLPCGHLPSVYEMYSKFVYEISL